MTQKSPIPDDQLQAHAMAGDAEEVYFEGSPLLRGELAKDFWWLLAGFILIALPIVIRVYHGEWMPFSFNLALVVIGLALWFIPWVQSKRLRFRITNYRIDFERGLFGRSIETLELWHVEDLRYYQSVLGRILAVGNITVLSKHPTTPMLVIPSLPNSKALFKTLEQRVIAVKRGSGVIKIDTGTAGIS